MKTKAISSILVIAMLLSMLCILPVTTSAAADTTEDIIAPDGKLWDGTTDSSWFDATTYADTTEYHISSAAQLASLKTVATADYSFSGKTIYIDEDIYLNNVTNIESDSEFELTKTTWNNFMIQSTFQGTLDGQNHSIYGLYLTQTNQTGFFLVLNANATAKNFRLMYAKILNDRGTSGMLASTLMGTVDNVHVLGYVRTKWNNCGGLAGLLGNSGTNYSKSITNCSVRGKIYEQEVRSGNKSACGGIAGMANFTTKVTCRIKNCYVYADVVSDATLSSPTVGGFIGLSAGANQTNITIENSGISGNLRAAGAVGGLIGSITLTGSNPIFFNFNNVYIAGSITHTEGSLEGALIGNYTNSMTNSSGKPTVKTTNLFVVTDSTSPVFLGKNEKEEDFGATLVSTKDSKSQDGLLATLNTWVGSNSGYTEWMMGHHGLPALVGTYEGTSSDVEQGEITTFGVLSGADIRINSPYETKLKFTAVFSKSYIDSLVAENTGSSISLGIVLAETAKLKVLGKDVTASAVLTANSIVATNTVSPLASLSVGEDGNYTIYGKTDALDLASVTTAYSAFAYIKIAPAEGEATIINGEYTKDFHSRSVLDVASAALDDAEANYSKTIKATLTSYLNASISIAATKSSANIVANASESYTSPYSVEEGSSLQSIVVLGENISADAVYVITLNGISYKIGKNYSEIPAVIEAGKITITPVVSSATTIKLEPGKVTLWENFPTTLTLACSVTSEIYSLKDLTWTSSNPSVITVNENGDLIPGKVGTAYVVATSPDGATSNTIEVTVIEEVVRAADQLLNIGSNKSLNIDVEKFLSNPTTYGTAQIAMWKNNATGAVSITIDDSIVGDFDAWDAATTATGIPVTFIVPANYYSSHAKDWQKVIAAGNDVQSHSYSATSSDTYNTWSTAQVWMDYYNALGAIEGVTGKKVNVIGYSYGWANDTLSALLHIAGRGTVGTSNKGNDINYIHTNSVSCKVVDADIPFSTSLLTLFDKTQLMYNNSYYGGWTSYHWHSVSVSSTMTLGGQTISNKTEYLTYYLGLLAQYQKEGKIWVDTFQNVAKYGQERDTAKLTVLTASENEMTFSLTDKMDDTLFTMPLTIKVMVDSTWTGATAVQNGVVRDAKLITADGNTYIYFDMVPDAGTLTLTATH